MTRAAGRCGSARQAARAGSGSVRDRANAVGAMLAGVHQAWRTVGIDGEREGNIRTRGFEGVVVELFEFGFLAVDENRTTLIGMYLNAARTGGVKKGNTALGGARSTFVGAAHAVIAVAAHIAVVPVLNPTPAIKFTGKRQFPATAALEGNSAVAGQGAVVQMRIRQFQIADRAVIPIQMAADFVGAFLLQIAHVVERGVLTLFVGIPFIIMILITAHRSGEDGQAEDASADRRCRLLVGIRNLLRADVPAHHLTVIDPAVETMVFLVPVLDQTGHLVGIAPRLLGGRAMGRGVPGVLGIVEDLVLTILNSVIPVVGKGGGRGHGGGNRQAQIASV